MNIKELVKKFGGQSALAQMLNVRQSAIAYWVKCGRVPSKWYTKLLSIAREKEIDILAVDLIFFDISGGKSKVRKEHDYASKNNLYEAHVIKQKRPSSVALQQFLFYASDSGSVKVQVMLEDETVWATQQEMADIFETTKQNISYHITNIFSEGELIENSVVKEILTTAFDNKAYKTKYYNLDAIISVGYRISSYKATQFRKWATTVLKEYLIKGFVLDDERLKQSSQVFGKDYFDELLERIRQIRSSERRFYQKITDLYSQCSSDYDKESPITKNFFAHVQDKLHYAVHQHTSAELIALRADSSKPHMGLTHWKNAKKDKKILPSDVTVGKNYLSETELEELERLVEMYLGFAENITRRKIVMTMKDWVEKLDGFLTFNAYDVLNNLGEMRGEEARNHALREYEKYRVIQDRDYQSDFDKIVDEIRLKQRLPK